MNSFHRNAEDDCGGIDRRGFLKAGALGTAALAAPRSWCAPDISGAGRPNFLFLVTDQQGLDTLSAYGCPGIHTPNLDRLVKRGTSFMESHCTYPLCSPARSSIFTGRMPSETGVVKNGLPIRSEIPNLGEWLGQNGYDSVYVGKWHVPMSYTVNIPGFSVIPAGNNGHGTLLDRTVSKACQGFLSNRTESDPFLLVASFLQPHDICQWTSMHKKAPDELPYPDIASKLPPLPPNFHFDKREPMALPGQRKYQKVNWSELQWRYYIWSYYRMVEEVDAEIGRVLQALEDSGHAENTIIVFTADHGEGRGRHQMIVKNYLYEEALKVPLVFSCPGRIEEDIRDREHLVSGVDIIATVCDFAGVKAPSGGVLGGNLRPFLEGKNAEWREFAMGEVKLNASRPGYAVRTEQYKYIVYHDDPVDQLFDMRKDPGETKNLSGDSDSSDVLKEHRKLFREIRSRLDLAANAPSSVILPG